MQILVNAFLAEPHCINTAYSEIFELIKKSKLDQVYIHNFVVF